MQVKNRVLCVNLDRGSNTKRASLAHRAREKSRKHLLEYNKSKGFPVEVFYTLSSETTSCSSTREASQVIRCDHNTIRTSLERSKEKGISKLIKKRFIVKFV